MTTNGNAPPRDVELDTDVELMEGGGDTHPSHVHDFEEDLGGGVGEAGVEMNTGGRRMKRNKWTRVSDVRPMKKADIDIYSTKKSVSQGFMDIALLTANGDQLRTLVTSGDPESPFRVVCIVFLSLSIVLQVVIAICLMLKGRYNINKEHHFRRAETVNNVCMIASILLTVFNVLVSVFSGEVPTMPASETESTTLKPFPFPTFHPIQG